MSRLKTVKAKINMGIAEGYGANIERNTLQFNKIVQDTCIIIFKETGIFVSLETYETTTIYHTEWGCPAGGENTYSLEAIANPEFVSDLEAWKNTVERIASILKSFFNQSTVTVQFQDAEITYLNI